MKIRPTFMDKKPYYVYILAYPDSYTLDDGTNLGGVVFYVGKGTVAPSGMNMQRMDHHEVEAKSECACKKCKTIRQIWDRGLSVSKSKVYETDDEAKALTLEQTHIEHTYASPYLTNHRYNQPKKQKITLQETEEERKRRLYIQRTTNNAFKRVIAEEKFRNSRNA